MCGILGPLFGLAALNLDATYTTHHEKKCLAETAEYDMNVPIYSLNMSQMFSNKARPVSQLP
jgi:hypothetical protein